MYCVQSFIFRRPIRYTQVFEQAGGLASTEESGCPHPERCSFSSTNRTSIPTALEGVQKLYDYVIPASFYGRTYSFLFSVKRREIKEIKLSTNLRV